MLIRKSTKNDAAGMIEVEHLVWTPGTTPGDTHYATESEYLLRNPPESKVVAEIDGKIAGILGFHSPIPLKSNEHVWMLDIAVHPDFQRHGVGSALMQELYRIAKAENKKKISLRVLSTNEKAIQFYKKHGFEKEGHLRNEFIIDGNYVDDIFMAVFL
ncbi:GNAT family N-acetyltransferase [Paenilisteria rocourtiae]|uniref:Ribosomal protein S18 acetylase RimI-like enzyme n=1 Tax=Listeria rocourtiae TaxID=647910 RepID=A0A4R6ZSI4_9LIST|nr:GNAT family N-acetyltransferase [Listeria rocourtiae]MBC1435675.1 GNAT family N-acetyltransferase [Listeria rocourtiae]TDR55671.1 ribosomal protein S18 acetylase RimI-like enzyme [Listeria rocourtiae]